MLKSLIWTKNDEIKSSEEKEAILKSLHNTKLDMEIDLDRIDKRETEKVNRYRCTFWLTQEEYDSLDDIILLDFGANVYIGRDMIFINGVMAGYTWCAGVEQKYTVSKDIFHIGENNAFIVIEYASGTTIWDNGEVITLRPLGYTTELEALPREVTFYNYDEKLEVSDVCPIEDGMVINFTNLKSMRITVFENGIYRFKYPMNASNIMDDMCLGDLNKNLKTVKPNEAFYDENVAFIITDYNTIKINLHPFSIAVEDTENRCIYRNNGIEFSANNVSVMEVDLKEDEHIFGLGENPTPTLDKRGRVEDIWIVHEAEKSDIPVPYYISTAGYGLYLNSACHSIFDMGKAVSDKALVYVYDKTVDVFFINGPDISDIVSGYGKITGIAPVPPKWAFGFWQAGAGVCTQNGAEDTINSYKANDIPLDVLCIDPGWQSGSHADLEWSTETFPQKESFLKKLSYNEINLILWMVPFANDRAECYQYHIDNKTGLLNDKGENYPIIYWKGKNSVAYDFSNEKAIEWLDKKIKKLLDDGVSGMKIDGGDAAEIPYDVKDINGQDGKVIHNLYPLYFNHAINSILSKHIPDKRHVTWQRSSYVGCGKYPCHWGGDQLAEFKHLKSLMKAGQACGLMNVFFWAEDIGGFCLTPNTDEEFFIRSYEWGCIAPLSRAHGGKTEPWAYGERALGISKKYIRLRYSLLPYIYSCAYEAHLYQKPIMAPMVYYNFTDERTYSRDYQYYFGESIMVAPAYKSDGNEDLSCEIDIYFPKGRWLDYWTGDVYEGCTEIKYTVPIDMLPMFIKIGSIIPYEKEITNTKHYNPDKLILNFYPSSERSTFNFYDDDGETFNYKNGEYNLIEFSCVNCDDAIEIEVKKLKDSYNKNYIGDYKFVVWSETKPSSITVNGKSFEFLYDEKSHKTVFDYRFL